VSPASNGIQQQLLSGVPQVSIATTGLLLDVLPHLISAAGVRKSKLGNRGRATKKWNFIAQYELELTQLQQFLLGYVGIVAGRTALAPQTRLALCNHPRVDVWQSPEVTERMSAELGEECHSFLQFLMRICKILARQVRSDTESVSQENDFVSAFLLRNTMSLIYLLRSSNLKLFI
jgi:hypothetical protein